MCHRGSSQFYGKEERGWSYWNLESWRRNIPELGLGLWWVSGLGGWGSGGPAELLTFRPSTNGRTREITVGTIVGQKMKVHSRLLEHQFILRPYWEIYSTWCISGMGWRSKYVKWGNSQENVGYISCRYSSFLFHFNIDVGRDEMPTENK